MGRGVDAAGQTGDHGQPGFGQLAGQGFRHTLAVGRGVAGTDHGDRAQLKAAKVAQHRNHRRRIVQQRQQRRISRGVEEQ